MNGEQFLKFMGMMLIVLAFLIFLAFKESGKKIELLEKCMESAEPAKCREMFP